MHIIFYLFTENVQELGTVFFIYIRALELDQYRVCGYSGTNPIVLWYWETWLKNGKAESYIYQDIKIFCCAKQNLI